MLDQTAFAEIKRRYSFATTIPMAAFEVYQRSPDYFEVKGKRSELPHTYWSIGSISMTEDEFIDIFKYNELVGATDQRNIVIKTQAKAKHQQVQAGVDGCYSDIAVAETATKEVGVGNLVRLNSGGPAMTVSEMNGDDCTVCYFYGGEYLEYTFKVAALTFLE